MKTLGSGRFGVLRLEQEATSTGVIRDLVVHFTRRIREPGFSLLGNGAPHIEAEREFASRMFEVLYRDGLERHAVSLA